MILDSTFLVDVLRGEGDVQELLEEVDAAGTPTVSSITVMELYEGIQLANTSEEERSAVETLLSEVQELPFDRACAMEAGRINAALSFAGEPIDETDVMIAATALVNGLRVVTRNVSQFERVDDVDVVTY